MHKIGTVLFSYLSPHVCKNVSQTKVTPEDSILSTLGTHRCHRFTRGTSPFEVHDALGDACGCIEGRQQFLTQLDGLYSEHLPRKVKGH